MDNRAEELINKLKPIHYGRMIYPLQIMDVSKAERIIRDYFSSLPLVVTKNNGNSED